MQQTRKVNEDALFERTKIFLRQMSARGVTTVEAKSGYGLSVEAELKQLRVYKRLQQEAVTRVVPTFLGAHTIPPEFKQKRTEYIDILCEQLLPQVAEQNLAKFCDVFCEVSAFSIEESRRILTRATNLGLKLKLHADQLSSFGAAELAADVGAISADHLEYASDAGLHAMAAHGVMPVLLPIATLYTREKWARMERFRKAGLPVAFASDFNPGSAPSFSLELVMLLACTQNGASPYEALQGVTINAARALQLQESIGSIEVGKLADFALIDALSVEEWISHFNPSREISVFKSGKLL
jgi:imidazolonepropionase